MVCSSAKSLAWNH